MTHLHLDILDKLQRWGRLSGRSLAVIPKPQKSHKKLVPSASYRTDTMIEFNPALAVRVGFFKRPLVARGDLCA